MADKQEWTRLLIGEDNYTNEMTKLKTKSPPWRRLRVGNIVY
jgi:hypothetical protein